MILLIGYGNPLRRDDGAGPVLARRLAKGWEAQGFSVRLRIEHQLLPELAPELAGVGVDAVVFIDADAAVSAPRVRRVCPDQRMSPGNGHSLTPHRLLTIAGMYSDSLPQAWMVSLPARDFGHGEGTGPIAAAAVDSCEELMKCFPGRIGQAPSSRPPE